MKILDFIAENALIDEISRLIETFRQQRAEKSKEAPKTLERLERKLKDYEALRDKMQ